MTIKNDQALQAGASAYKRGNFRKAEKLYRSVLQNEPHHSQANSSLGILLVELDRKEEALAYLKIALENNLEEGVYWTNYIKTLIQMGRLESAGQVIQQGKMYGLKGQMVENLELVISNKTSSPAIKGGLKQPSQSQLEKLTNLLLKQSFDEALEEGQKLMREFPENTPILNYIGAIKSKTGKGKEAIQIFKKAIELKPDFAEVWSNLGNVYKSRNQLSSSKSAYKKAIVLKPNYAPAYNNYGVSLRDGVDTKQIASLLKRAINIEPSYSNAYYNLGAEVENDEGNQKPIPLHMKALILKPNNAQAYNSLGTLFVRHGRHKTAISDYAKAILLEPHSAEFWNNLANAYYTNSDYSLSIKSYNEAIKRDPDNTTYFYNLAGVLAEYTPRRYSEKLADNYLQILNLNGVARPSNLVVAVIALLKRSNVLRSILDFEFPNKFDSSDLNVYLGLLKLPLFLKILELCPIPDLEIEEFLTRLRRTFLTARKEIFKTSDLLKLQTILALQCFTNEFIFKETLEETKAIELLENDIKNTFLSGSEVAAHDIACLASYRILNKYSWSKNLINYNDIEILVRRQIVEVHREKQIEVQIPKHLNINGYISKAVKAQYEENPYPRWVNTSIFPKPLSIKEVIYQVGLSPIDQAIFQKTLPRILIAGCGTGQHSIQTATRFKNCQVTAIDISLRSLSYAKRKTEEFCINNVEYIQADILNLETMSRRYDIIESVGVLHHMEDPFLGWKVLERCLRPGGLMKIGLYGEISRQHVVKARDLILRLKKSTAHKEMIEVREYIKRSSDPILANLLQETDFYNTSNFRDLVFHAQEHRFTAPQLYDCFDSLNLHFIGFEFPFISEKKKFHTLLKTWKEEHRFGLENELDFPTHCFWLQKPVT